MKIDDSDILTLSPVALDLLSKLMVTIAWVKDYQDQGVLEQTTAEDIVLVIETSLSGVATRKKKVIEKKIKEMANNVDLDSPTSKLTPKEKFR